jgi:hypothetical protein
MATKAQHIESATDHLASIASSPRVDTTPPFELAAIYAVLAEVDTSNAAAHVAAAEAALDTADAGVYQGHYAAKALAHSLLARVVA